MVPRILRILAPALAGLALFGAPAALAAPPANDTRGGAVRITPPGSANGTLVEATVDESEPSGDCGETDASVWYRFNPPARGSVIVQFDGAGDLDATVDVYERTRSRLSPVDCDQSDRKGRLTLELDELNPERDYLIRVGKLAASDPAGFRLSVLVPQPPANPPGRPLPARGARDSVDRLLNPSDAWSTFMRAGTTYRLNLATDGCAELGVYPPGTRSFGRTPDKVLRCGGYRLFTPTRSGRYVLRVEGGRRRRSTQRYRLRVGAARADDTTPGIFIRNNARVRGSVNDRLDSVDLYRFDVLRRSTLTLRVSGGPELTLLRDNGKRVESGSSSIERSVGAGRYFVAVRGRGRYRLRRISRTITKSTLSFGSRRIGPGSSTTLNLGVRPGVDGRGRMVVERFDPLSGWQFLRVYRVRVSGGRASVPFTPPSVGRYRAQGEFRGSRIASPSTTGVARLRVAGPLQE